jgi:hypothetical protein
MTQITGHGESCTGEHEENKPFESKFYDVTRGSWRFQKSLKPISGLKKAKCAYPSGRQVHAICTAYHGISDDVQSVTFVEARDVLRTRKALYSRGREGVAKHTLGEASTYVSTQLREYIERNMPDLATNDTIGVAASIYNAKGEKMMTYHLEARMAKTVRSPRSQTPADL